MCFFYIAVQYNDPVEAVQSHHIIVDRYEMVEFGDACQPRLDLSDQKRACGIASTDVIRLGSNNMLLMYRADV